MYCCYVITMYSIATYRMTIMIIIIITIITSAANEIPTAAPVLTEL